MAVCKTVLIHYNVPPVAGGVERVVGEHAKLFGMYGDVVLLYGNGDERFFGDEPNLAAVKMEEIDLRSSAVHAAMADLGGPEYISLKNRLKERLRDFCSDANFVIGHNVFTMPFHLPLTVALVELSTELTGVQFVAWVHDVGVAHPHVVVPPGEIWQVLRQAHPTIRYVAVSETRRQDVLAYLGAPECTVVPNGIDVFEFLGSSLEVAELAGSWEFFEADMVLLAPVRILRRKNLELVIRATKELVTSGRDARLVITGAPDLYNYDSRAYERELRALIRELGLEEAVCFVHEYFRPSDEDIRCLYQLSDAVVFPSHHEGFGLPLIEAALTKTPIFCSDIQPVSTLFSATVECFSPKCEPSELASLIDRELLKSASAARFRECLRQFECFTLFKNTVEPMLGLGDLNPANRRKP